MVAIKYFCNRFAGKADKDKAAAAGIGYSHERFDSIKAAFARLLYIMGDDIADVWGSEDKSIQIAVAFWKSGIKIEKTVPVVGYKPLIPVYEKKIQQYDAGYTAYEKKKKASLGFNL